MTRIPGSDPDRGGAQPPHPDRIGPYRILDVLGEGGMGTVYLASQREPVRRRVALKVIKLGISSKDVLARFQLERQALAVMNHDNIARVFDAGTTEQGQWIRLSGEPNPSAFEAGDSDRIGGRVTLAHPVESVTWFRCDDLMRAHGLMLPTRAQWDLGCRAGTTSRWFTGDEPESLNGVANILDESAQEVLTSLDGISYFRDGYVVHAPVGSFRANDFGLYDVHGNVWEWCRDRIEPVRRAYSGGGWHSVARQARPSYRGSSPASTLANTGGLRPAREVTRN